MATQGLVTVRKDGKVVMKFVAGCDGSNAVQLANMLREMNKSGVAIPSLELAYAMAVEHQFGSINDLVVMDEHSEEFHGDENLSDLYRETFDQPRFNPRWKLGTADYVEIVDLQ